MSPENRRDDRLLPAWSKWFLKIIRQRFPARPRIQALGNEIIALAKSREARVSRFSRQHVRKIFFADGKGTNTLSPKFWASDFRKSSDAGCRRSAGLG